MFARLPPVLVLWACVSCALAVPHLDPVTPPAISPGAPAAMFVASTPADFNSLPDSGAPVWDVRGPDGGRTRGWLWASPEHLLVRVVVSGRKHQNDFSGKQSWRGDCIYLSLDGLGDTPAGADAFEQPDDLLVFAAKDAGGIAARIIEHGRPEQRQLDCSAIVRAISPTTDGGMRYDLALPWSLLSSGPGATPVLGLAHTAAFQGGGDLAWGAIRAAHSNPRKLAAVRLPDTQLAPAAAIIPICTQVASQTGHARLRAVLASPAIENLTLTLGGQPAIELPVPRGGGLRRFDLIIPADDIAAKPATAALGNGGPTPAARLDFHLETPDTRLAEVRARFTKLRDSAPHPLLREHCESTLSLVEAAHERLAYETDTPERAEEFLDFTHQILTNAPTERYDWEEHVARGLPLLLRFLSPGDNSLQFYTLQVPVTPAPDSPRPLTVYLHGRGNPNNLSDVSFAFSNTGQDTLFDRDPVPTNPVPFVHTGYIAAPWARGNRSYQDIAHEDVLAMLADVERRFPIDPDRRYLTGFSMGGAGAFQIAARTPDRWAAVSVAAIATGLESSRSREFYHENLAHLPLDIWVGELDSRFRPVAQALSERRASTSAPTRFTVAPRTPHTYPYAAFKENTEWLGRHTRRHPTEIHFTADHPDHLSAFGVTFPVSRGDRHRALRGSDDTLPRFHLRIEGKTVRLDYAGAKAIEFAPGALGLPADASFMINGETVSPDPAAPKRPLSHPAPRRSN